MQYMSCLDGIGLRECFKTFQDKISIKKNSDKFLFAKLSSRLDFVNTIFHLANGFVPKSRCILSDKNKYRCYQETSASMNSQSIKLQQV